MSPLRIGLVAHLIGDGSYIPNQGIKYTTGSEENSTYVTQAAMAEFGSIVRRYPGRGAWHSLLFVGNGNRWHPSGLGKWLMDVGIYGQRSRQKRVPEAVFRLDTPGVALFLRHIWATDGTLKMARAELRGSRVISFSTASPGLASDVAALLLRLGIVSRIRSQKRDGVYLVVISGHESLLKFLDVVGCFGPKAQDGIAFRRFLSLQGENNPNVDTLPIEIWGDVKRLMRAQGISQRKMCALRGTSYGGDSHFRFAPSRETIRSYAGILKCDDLRDACDSDIFWDCVVSVAPAGTTDVYDLTVPGVGNWCSDGIITHNSGEIEQEADSVFFLWTDERDIDQSMLPMYITLAKHRHGPTGKIAVTFDKARRRFILA
jgi:replicative DNA helicase